MFNRAGQTLLVLAIIVASGAGVSAAARAGVLIQAAFPFAVGLVVLLRLFPAPAERWAWVGFTVWLGSTYLATGAAMERVALVAYMVAAALGAFVSPLYLVAAWLLHPVWDFLPRTLPPLLTDLPVACLLFDLPIGAYIAWAWKQRRWDRRLVADGEAATG